MLLTHTLRQLSKDSAPGIAALTRVAEKNQLKKHAVLHPRKMVLLCDTRSFLECLELPEILCT